MFLSAQLSVGDYDFTVGKIKFYASKCDNPAENCKALIGGLVGGLGGGILVIGAIVAAVAYHFWKKRQEKLRITQLNQIDPFRIYTGK